MFLYLLIFPFEKPGEYPGGQIPAMINVRSGGLCVTMWYSYQKFFKVTISFWKVQSKLNIHKNDLIFMRGATLCCFMTAHFHARNVSLNTW